MHSAAWSKAPAAAGPLVEQIARLNMQIGAMDQQIEKLAIKYPEIGTLRSAPGVGALVAAAYVLTLDHPNAVPSSRSAGAFLGLRPGQSQSGSSDPQRRITRTGNTYLRCLLVQSAQYVLGRFGPDSALRLGPEAGRQRRQVGQEASHRRRGPQTGRHPAQHVAQRPALPTLSTTGSGAGLTGNATATSQPTANQR